MEKINNLQEIINDTACPSGYIYHIEDVVREYNPNSPKGIYKKHILLILKILLERNVIQAIEPFSINHDRWELTPTEIIIKIDRRWKKNIEHEVYYDIVWLRQTEEFKGLLLKNGYIFDTDWNIYIENSLWLQEFLKIDECEFKKRLNKI